MSILERIVAAKRDEVAQRKAQLTETELRARLDQAPPPRDFLAALREPDTVQVIAEIKRASPSAGSLNTAADILPRASDYERCGAACVSVLTDEPHFHGSLADLTAVRTAISRPVLRKDFILDPYQILEARRHGADAVLLIAEILDDADLRNLRLRIEELGMTALVECWSARNLERVLASGAALVGINCRDLNTFEIDLDHIIRLAPQVPSDRTLVGESGVRARADVEKLAAAGVAAVLVGETLMRSPDLPATLANLTGVPKQPRG